MSLSANNALELSKSIIAEFHRYFVAGGVDNYDHVMAINQIGNCTWPRARKSSGNKL